jgi:small subunit ribosomal protein S8
MTDPIADFLTRIRNANRALLPAVEAPYSKLKEGIARLLKREGYIADWSVQGDKIKTLKLRLKYNGRQGVIEGIRRVSRPGLRRYARATEIPRVLGGLGLAILSTSRGVVTGVEARKLGVGGEIICHIW